VVFELEGRFLSIPGSSFPRDVVTADLRQMAKKKKKKKLKWKCNKKWKKFPSLLF